MKTLIYLPTMLIEFLKARMIRISYRPSTEGIRAIEQDVRNEMRLAAYRIKK